MEEGPGHLIHQAVAFNNVDLLESLLQGDEKEHVDLYDDKNRTALYKAVEESQVACCHLLLESGADPNIKCGPRTNCHAPLHAAAANDDVQLVGLLLEFGGNWYAQSKDGLTALDLAQKCKADDVVHIIESYARDREKLLYKACADRDIVRAKHVVSQLPRKSVSKVISKGGSRYHSLLFKACEEGDLELAEFLLDNDCDIGIHPVSGQSPLHAACASGKLACTQMVLEKFPELINAPTIDGILPVHTACIVGQMDILNLLLNFNYPKAVMKRFKEPNGDRMYRLGLSIVAKDGHGRTPLHIGCMMIHPDIVETLLKFKVKVTSKYNEGEIRRMNSSGVLVESDVESSLDDTLEQSSLEFVPLDCGGNTQGTEVIGEVRDPEITEVKTRAQRTINCEKFSPVCAEIDSIDLDGNSALHVIIKHIVTQIEPEERVYQIAEKLLYHGANPDKPMVTPSGNMSPVNYVCGEGHSRMVEMLLNYNATDQDGKAFATALKHSNEDILGVFLRTKNHVDSSYKVNSVDLLKLFKDTIVLDTWSSQTVVLKRIWPNIGVYLEWHGLQLNFISREWLVNASKQHNRKPRGCLPKVENLSLFAITRIDISHNQLTHLPEEFSHLPSLRILNVSNNRIKWMPGCEINVPRSCSCMVVDCGHIAAKCEHLEQKNQLWNLPVLEEINLQYNKLSTLPTGLLRKESCPNLRKLNVSHNKLGKLPSEVWTSESLMEVNVSHNHIEELTFSDEPSISRSSTITSGVISDLDTSDPVDDKLGETEACLLSESESSPFKAVPVTTISHHGKLQIKETTQTSEEQIQKSSTCQLSELNLSHNKFKEIPIGLACVTPQLSKLNLSHNLITSMVSTSSLPVGITELDLSHNQLEDWASQQLLLEFIDSSSIDSMADVMCYSKQKTTRKFRSLKTVSKLSMIYCPHRFHTQLEKLRLLKLNNNQLVRFSVRPKQINEDDSEKSFDSSGSYQRGRPKSATSRNLSGSDSGDNPPQLYFPNLSVLDLSHNLLSVIEKEIALLGQLTELRLAHNDKLVELPPEMGLFKKLWNLDITNCPVQQTLQSLLGDSIKRTVVILNYLKSVKENATVYNHMKLMFVGVQGIGKTSLLERLRGQGTVPKGQTQKKNWSQRMGQSTVQNRSQTGETISTVGVDIGDLILKKNNKEVVFSTWDFGGQREYYATHQYFLSKRSLYLVVWKLTDGERGVHQILQWLVNIQARAPNSPVVIVGTHLDKIDKSSPPGYVQHLRKLVCEKYMSHAEPDKSGLPRVLGIHEVTTKRFIKFLFSDHISDLVNTIVRVATEEPLPGSKGGYLLDQKVPAIYVNLERVVREIAQGRKIEGKDPVLHAEQYKVLVMHKMDELGQESFRDMSELHQASQFLHENGVLLHYNDVSLQDIYFLDPQWLCDVLANVVTIREINSLAKRGIMKTDDLKVLFKNAAFRPEDIKTYIINLLNKFEVALQWDDQNLLIPSMLPSERDMKAVGFREQDKIPVLGSSEKSKPLEKTVIVSGIRPEAASSVMNFNLEYADSHHTPMIDDHRVDSMKNEFFPDISVIQNPNAAIVRLYLMSYFPSGFWPRIITRLLGDPSFYATTLSLYDLPDVLSSNDSFMKSQGTCPWWQCWQTGLKLKFLNATILKVKEVVRDSGMKKFCDYHQCQLLTQLSGGWEPVDADSISILEILIPNEALNVTIQFEMDPELKQVQGREHLCQESVTIRPNPQVAAVLLTKIVEHIDTLLEDWYPDLGSRFVQNSKGMYLITRLVPCIRCLVTQAKLQQRHLQSKKAWQCVSSADQKKRVEVDNSVLAYDLSSANTVVSGYAGSAPTTNGFHGASLGHTPSRQGARHSLSGSHKIFGVCVESCVLASGEFPYAPSLGCKHGSLSLVNLAPDVVFQDVGEQFLIDSDLITRDHFLGKGAFGAVYAGSVIHKQTGEPQPVAMKMMQPVEPDKEASDSLKKAYQVEMEKWNKHPMKHACDSYLNLRKELSILLSLQHDHIVGILGISLHPLCLVLNLAPMGSLADQLCNYKRIGNRLSVYTVQQVIVQVASALAYLHSNQIIYRDLKSENVLVWSFPPYDDPLTPADVDIRLADYGVSRSVLPTGTKGLAGTPPFIAPEIIQHNGEESYTEKVDCFSFGMFLFELLTLRTPFEGESSNQWAVRGHKDSYVMSGLRPSITKEDHVYPSHIFDLMTLCWSQEPQDRPPASAIIEIAQRPEFCHMYQVVSMEEQEAVICAVCAPHVEEKDWDEDEADLVTGDVSATTHDIWVSSHKGDHSRDGGCSSKSAGQGSNVLSLYSVQGIHCTEAKRLELSADCQVTHMCVTGDHVWCADSQGSIHIYSVRSPKELLVFPASSKPGVKVKSLVYASEERKVYVVLDNGGFSVCDCYQEEDSDTVIRSLVSQRSSQASAHTNNNLVRMECPGNKRPIHCMVALTRRNSSELWCGQDQGKLSIWYMGKSASDTKAIKLASHPTQNQYPPDVYIIATSPDDYSTVWSYVYPGTVIYRWDVESRQISHSTDLTTYVPSLPDKEFQKYIKRGKIDSMNCQVTALCSHAGHLFTSITLGCILVLDADTMNPVSVLHSHLSTVRLLIPLYCVQPPTTATEVDALSASSSAGSLKDECQSSPVILSIGKGYQDMIERLVPNVNVLRNKDAQFMLVWKAEGWAYTGKVEFVKP